MQGAGSGSKLRSKEEVYFESRDCEVENVGGGISEEKKIIELEKQKVIKF